MAIWDKPTQEEFKEMRRHRHERERQWRKEDEERRKNRGQKSPKTQQIPTFDENWKPEQRSE